MSDSVFRSNEGSEIELYIKIGLMRMMSRRCIIMYWSIRKGSVFTKQRGGEDSDDVEKEISRQASKTKSVKEVRFPISLGFLVLDSAK